MPPLLGSAADAVVLVVRAGHTQADDLRYAMDQLEAAGAPFLGTLLNDIDLRRHCAGRRCVPLHRAGGAST